LFCVCAAPLIVDEADERKVEHEDAAEDKPEVAHRTSRGIMGGARGACAVWMASSSDVRTAKFRR